MGLVGRRQILAAGALLTTVPAPTLRASSGRPLRLGFAGVGNRGETNLFAMKHESVVAVCDVDERYLEKSKSVAPMARRYRDFRELIRHEDRTDDRAPRRRRLRNRPDHEFGDVLCRADIVE